MTTPLKGLRKLPVVDTSSADTVGRMESVVIDPSVPTVVAIAVKDGRLAPFDRLEGIGPDAVTVPTADVLRESESQLPRDTDAYGLLVLDDAGYALGSLTDLHMAEDGRIVEVLVDGEPCGRTLIGMGSYAVVVSRRA
jgi:sporulation protein YlmC with PRC-barrel domain